MKLWYVGTDFGCTIRKAKTAHAAEYQVRKEQGTRTRINATREATDEDIAWVRGMGGYVPSLPKERVT